MSCSLTTEAVRARTKTVTRRAPHTWRNLRRGDRLTLIEKGMGLAKGEKQVVLAEVEILSNRLSRLGAIDPHEVELEGFGTMDPADFVDMWLRSHGCNPARMSLPQRDDAPCRRIEWRYLDDQDPTG